MESMRRFFGSACFVGAEPPRPTRRASPPDPLSGLPVSGCAPSHWLHRWTPSRFCPSRVARFVGFVAVPLGCDRSGSDVVRGPRPGTLPGLSSRVVRWWRACLGALWFVVRVVCCSRASPGGLLLGVLVSGCVLSGGLPIRARSGPLLSFSFNRVAISSPNVVRRRLVDRRWQRRKPASLRPRSCVRPRFGNR